MKRKGLIYRSIWPLLILFLASCSNTKYLPENEALYTGATVKVSGDDLSRKKRKALTSELNALTRPKPNRKFLGMRFKLWVYNIAGNPKSETSFRGKLKNKTGEPPVLLSSVKLTRNSDVLENYLENHGYFQASVTADTTVKHKKATATYTVKTGVQYVIDTVRFELDSSFLANTIRQTEKKSLLKRGEPFNLDMIKIERERIDAYLKDNGFYYFNPEHLLIETDSTIGNHKVNMYVTLKRGIPPSAKEMYTIKDVMIYTNFRLNAASDTTANTGTLYKGYNVVDRNKQFKPYLFETAMQFQPNDIYNRKDHNLSLSRIINMGVFKFVKNRFEKVPNSPFAQLNTYYYLTPYPKKSIRAEINGTSKSNNLVGSNIAVSWRNRNTFRAGELLKITASGGAEIQYSSAQKGYNVYRLGLEGSLSFPRFLIPFFRLDTKGAFVPKTNMMVGYDMLNKSKLYTLNSFRTSYGWAWKENLYKEHQFNPIAVNYVQPLNVTPEYEEMIKTDPTLAKAIEKQFILGNTYNFTYDTRIDKPAHATGVYFSGTLDMSGNLAGLIFGDSSKGKSGQVFGAVFSQYVKGEADLRYYLRTGTHSSWANRLIIGGSLPHGNSKSLPYIKQFFSGGTNSIRAFRNRNVGPGTYYDVNQTGVPDQTGDIKLELNTEIRAKLFSIVEGAAFVDAGNIWLYNEETLKPGAKFTKDFYKELAVGAGVGLRLDVSILIVRLDVAFPLRKPWLPDGERWVIKQIDLGNGEWRKNNIIWNLGIGYPF
ncbi:BamA/TamA family outer membrane protein [Paraflavitalea sp. CAU 1676]|uniref:translocation and assembly module lipoprotein TamL n=1 Tax=Paraflavitalea sp. CAU 1676 TaxID=3032598 RepID=UPI0023DC81FA|nr:BamA/TamA family outer membrane protein [Paraflavitalea sp. CAU 1676]MDF2191558.1 BamA/TamA family outer membrane protein [Paraflavitalea sp. CAU 1676]